jgi:hypothetical protein
MAEDDKEDEAPLGAEAAKRAEWRGEADVAQDADSSAHTIGASEGGDPDDSDRGRAAAGPGIVPMPPD